MTQSQPDFPTPAHRPGLFARLAYGSAEVWGIDINADEGRLAQASRVYAHGIVDIELTAERITIEPWEIEQFKDLVAQRTRVFASTDASHSFTRPDASASAANCFADNVIFGASSGRRTSVAARSRAASFTRAPPA